MRTMFHIGVLSVMLQIFPTNLSAMSFGRSAFEEQSITVDCTFERKCVETDCAASNINLTFSGTKVIADDSEGIALLSLAPKPQRGSMVLIGSLQRGVASLMARTAISNRILTINDGQARYSVHLFDGPEATTYIGQCELDT